MSDNSPQNRIRQGSSSESERKSRKGIIIAVMCALIAVAAIIACVILFSNPDKEQPANPADEQKRNIVVTPDNVDEMLDQVLEKSKAGRYEVSMSLNWEFADGKSASSNAYVENRVSNSNAVYFDIVLEDNEEDVIYSSPIIPVGSHLKEITLDKDLDAGKYDCVVIYHLVDDDQKEISTVRMTLDITIAG